MQGHKPVPIKLYRVFLDKEVKLTTDIKELAVDVFKEYLALSQGRNMGPPCNTRRFNANRDVTLMRGDETIASTKDC